MITEDTILVGFNAAHGEDQAVLIIGRRPVGEALDIVNAFQGDEAVELYKKLVTKKEKEE